MNFFVPNISQWLNKETALPGGRVDDIDANINDTALREAAEEVELDTGDCPLVFLTRLQPILSRNLLFVFPVVYFVASPRPAGPLRRLRANPQEVASIFNAPLSGFILRSEIQHSWTDVSSFMGATYRLHAFDHASFDSPITGMTAEVLIRVASIAYGVDQLPFDLVAPGSGRNSAESVALLVQQHREQGLLE